jgi:hypothetical protein
MPTPIALDVTLWESKTPSNMHELGSQSILIRDRIQRHQDSSPTAIIQSLDQLRRGGEVIGHELVLLCNRVSRLEKANEATTRCKQCKRKRIQKRSTLTKVEGEDVIAQRDVEQQLESETRQGNAQLGVSRHASACCKLCRQPGHNSRTCEKRTLDTT